jgi:RND family efflux transporter MFP subunit
VQAAQVTVNRLVPLVAHGIAAQQELDTARAQFAQARGVLARVQEGAQQTARDVGRAEVVAPFAGTVLRVVHGAGELVDGTPATPIVELGDDTQRVWIANATAEDLLRVEVGMQATIGLDDHTVRARVERVAVQVDPNTGVGAVQLRADEAVRGPLGLTGEVRIELSCHENVRVVPDTALRAREDDTAEVLLCEDGHVTAKTVTLGLQGEGVWELLEGLEPDARIVPDRVVGIEDGTALEGEDAQ